jgi:hypothetical protein
MAAMHVSIALFSMLVSADVPREPLESPSFFHCALALEGAQAVNQQAFERLLERGPLGSVFDARIAHKRLVEQGASEEQAAHLVSACANESADPSADIEAALRVTTPSVQRFVEAALAWEQIRIRDAVVRQRVLARLTPSGAAYVEGLSLHDGNRRATLLERAAKLDGANTERALCAIDALITVGKVREAEALALTPRATDHRRLLGIARARIAARRGDAALAEKTWRALPARGEGDFSSVFPCRFLTDGGCNLSADLLAAGKPDDALGFGKACHAHAGARAAKGETFDALIESRSAREGPYDMLLAPRLLALLGRPDMARRQLAGSVEQCRAGATHLDCEAIEGLMRELPASQSSVRPELAMRFAQPPFHARFAISVVKSASKPRERIAPIPGTRGLLYLTPPQKKRAAVTVGYYLEEVSDAPAPDIVVFLSQDGGATWSKPILTGMRAAGVAPLDPSNAASFDGRVLQLPLDQLNLPGLQSNPRERDDRVIAIEIAQLKRDSDRDGIPDVTEELFATNPLSADSDGDGVDDAKDAQPLEAPTTSAATRFLAEVLRGEVDPQKIYVSNEPMPDLGHSFVRLSFDEYALYAKKLNAGRPVTFEVIVDSSGKRALVVVDGPLFHSSDVVTQRPDGTFRRENVSAGVE